MKPPVYVGGGKRLNFTRRDEYGDGLNDGFTGYGKSEGTYPSTTWDELCAFATLIVNHPAYEPPGEPSAYYPPKIEDEA